MISLLTLCTGIGAKEAIKNQIGDFNGHLTIKSTRSNTSYNTSPLQESELKLKDIRSVYGVDAMQSSASVSGILRTEKDFFGVIYKGVSGDFVRERFSKFLIKGTLPQFKGKGYQYDIVVSQKIAQEMQLKLNDSVAAVFSREDQQPIYRKFRVSGIYRTDIKLIDEHYILGDINHARKILGMDQNQRGGIEIFLKDFDASEAIASEIRRHIGLKNFVEKATDKYPQILDWVNIFDTNISIILGLMLIVVMINIIMVMLILIIERTRSIGILKTLGVHNGQIRQIFISYTLLIMLPGLIVGNLIGLGLLFIQKTTGIIRLNPDSYFISEVPVDFNPIYILGVSVGIFGISALAMILPSYIISRIDPVKSLKLD